MTEGLDLLARSISWWLDHPFRLLGMWVIWILCTGAARGFIDALNGDVKTEAD